MCVGASVLSCADERRSHIEVKLTELCSTAACAAHRPPAKAAMKLGLDLIVPWLLLALRLNLAKADNAGFCLDEVPRALHGTGFTAVSSIRNEVVCVHAGQEWCPLSNKTDIFDPGDGSALEYYWYSTCCTPQQPWLRRAPLFVDAVGLPTCRPGLSANQCQWR